MTTDEAKTQLLARDELPILMPAPGGQATLVLHRPDPTPPERDAPADAMRRLWLAQDNPLLAAAAVLLGLVAQLRGTVVHADPAGLRRELLAHVAAFESMAAAGGVARHQIGAARYLLCAFLDEVIDGTPWGGGGVWRQRTLLQEFHEEAWGGEKASKLVERLSADVATNRALLELFYICLLLGFEGRHHGRADARRQADLEAARLLELLRPASGRSQWRDLAPRWQSAVTRTRDDMAVVPAWVIACVGGALVIGSMLWLNAGLQRLSEPLLRQLHDLPMALSSGRPVIAAKPRLAPLLKMDIDRHALTVRDEAQRSIVTIATDGLFAGAGARLDSNASALLDRVAAALNPQPGQVLVIGHTDHAPPADSLQFPSNWKLSRDQAQAVEAALLARGLPAARLRAEGRADAEPLTAAQGAAQPAANRRIEIELQLARPES